MIFGLKTWWLPAIGTPFIDLYVSGWSLLSRYFCNTCHRLFSSYDIIVKRLGKVSTAALLAGETDFDEVSPKTKSQRIQTKILIGKRHYDLGIVSRYYMLDISYVLRSGAVSFLS